MKKVQIIGGGFCGLSLSYFFLKKGYEVTLVEKQERLGGMIGTRKIPLGIVETAANALLSNEVVERVARDLQLDLVKTLPSAKRRYIFRTQPRRMPLGFHGGWRVASFLFRYFTKSSWAFPLDGESIDQWGQRVLGSEATNYLLIPALSGIYAGDAKRLSASLILNRMLRGVRPPKGKWKGSVAPKGGMYDWIQRFEDYFVRRGGIRAHEPNFDLPTVFAIPAHELSAFQDQIPELWQFCSKIEYLPLVSATVFFSEKTSSESGSNVRNPRIDGFGCLFPKDQGIRALGMLSNASIFPERCWKGFSETWISGGALDSAILQLNDSEIVESLLQDRKKIFPSTMPAMEPEHWEICRWPKAIPHYTVDLEFLLKELEKRKFREKHFSLFGTYLGDLGLARILPRAERFVEEF